MLKVIVLNWSHFWRHKPWFIVYTKLVQSEPSSVALLQQREVWLMIWRRRRRHRQMVCRSSVFDGPVWTEQLWGPCLEHGVVIRTSTYCVDVQSLLSGVDSLVFLPALCGVQMDDGQGHIWGGDQHNLIEISKVRQIRRTGFLDFFSPVLLTKL